MRHARLVILLLALFPRGALCSDERGPSESAAARLSELKLIFMKLDDFVLRYRYSRKTSDRLETSEGETVRATERVDGKLKVKSPGKLRFNGFESLESWSDNRQRELLYVTNGVLAWKRIACPVCDGRTVRAPAGRQSERAASGKKLLLSAGARDCPACFLADPYLDIPGGAILKGEETIDGVKTLRVECRADAKSRRREYWIGLQDGIPRKILEYHLKQPKVQVEYLISDVKVNQSPPGEDFESKRLN